MCGFRLSQACMGRVIHFSPNSLGGRLQFSSTALPTTYGLQFFYTPFVGYFKGALTHRAEEQTALGSSGHCSIKIIVEVKA